MMQRLVKDFYKVLNQVDTEEIPDGLKLPDSFSELVSEMKNNQYDAKTFGFMLRAMVCCSTYIFLSSLSLIIFGGEWFSETEVSSCRLSFSFSTPKIFIFLSLKTFAIRLSEVSILTFY